MTYTLVVAGSGQLGSRYLQGLVSAETPLDIIAVDASRAALELSQERWLAAGGAESLHRLRLGTSWDVVPTSVDLAIVATTSRGRLDVVRQLASQANVRFWILEKLLTSNPDELPRFLEQVALSESAWVNLPYRAMNWHQAMRRQLAGRGPCAFDLGGSNYGLLTNVIHYLDLIGWWMDAPVVEAKFAPDVRGFYWSKRSNYVESNGAFEARFADGTRVTMRCDGEIDDGGLASGLTFDISSSDDNWHIDEEQGVMRDSTGRETRGRIELQSEMTSSVVSRILSGAACDLPRLDEVIPLHQRILAAIQAAWMANPITGETLVPVT